jgi:hypothetical protein
MSIAEMAILERARYFIAAFAFRTKLKKLLYGLTKWCNAVRYERFATPKPKVIRIGTKRPSRHDALSQCRQFAPTRATSARDTHSATELTPNELRPAPVRKPPYGGRKIDVTAERREA